MCSSLSALIRYPRRAIFAPFLYFLFNITEVNRTRKLPDFVLTNGTVRCRDLLITVTEKVIPFKIELNVRQATEDHFCHPSVNISWSELAPSRQSCHRANESTDQCGEWNPCWSLTRRRDGWTHCLNRRDESQEIEMEIEKSCARVRRHRFRCSPKQVTCLSVMGFAANLGLCNNFFNFAWFGDGQRIGFMHCNQQRKGDCSLLRQYVAQSWKEMNTSERPSPVGIPFRSYCNSFWDLPTRKDENLRECRRW
jgi:hypothetical protein